MTILYVYCQPDTASFSTEDFLLPGTPFYGGIGASKRHLDHLKEVKSGKFKKTDKLLYIKSLCDYNTPPIILVLESDLTVSDAKLAEKKLIAEIGTRKIVKGVATRGPLFNEHRGGGGGVGLKRPHTAETCAKIAASKRGKKLSAEHCAAIGKGNSDRPRSSEENKRRGEGIARALQARPKERTQEIMEKRKAAGWISDEARRALDAKTKAGHFRKNVQSFVATDPNGVHHEGPDLTAFCLDLGLDPQNAWANLSRTNPIKKGRMKGWRFTAR